jgi:hypothetical protein
MGFLRVELVDSGTLTFRPQEPARRGGKDHPRETSSVVCVDTDVQMANPRNYITCMCYLSPWSFTETHPLIFDRGCLCVRCSAGQGGVGAGGG